METVQYLTVDVFTTERFTGNPLAVVADARGLSAREMQQIATEFNYAESTFVLPPESPANTARVRIFTPTAEVPFAGHPNVGTAFVLGRIGHVFGRPVADVMRFEELAGLVEVELQRTSGQVSGATIRAPRPLEVREPVAVELVAACASLEPADIVASPAAPVIATVGLPFAFAEVRTLDALDRARPDAAAFAVADARHPQPEDRFSLFLYTRLAAPGPDLRARMFAPLDNVPEDPATGSASAALAALLVTRTAGVEARVRMTIEQGVTMRRRSLITLDVEKVAGKVAPVRITGNCVEVMRGEIAL